MTASIYLLLPRRTLEQARADIEEAKWRRREREFDKWEDEKWAKRCNSMRDPYAPYGSEK